MKRPNKLRQSSLLLLLFITCSMSHAWSLSSMLYSETTDASSDETNKSPPPPPSKPTKKKKKKKILTNSRDLEASITASSWSTSIYSPLCETWAYLDAAPSTSTTSKNVYQDWKLKYLDTLISSSSIEELTEYEEVLSLALEVASTSYVSTTNKEFLDSVGEEGVEVGQVLVVYRNQ
eukprot:10892160-Ditylum_brightwellii.AAC.1